MEYELNVGEQTPRPWPTRILIGICAGLLGYSTVAVFQQALSVDRPAAVDRSTRLATWSNQHGETMLASNPDPTGSPAASGLTPSSDGSRDRNSSPLDPPGPYGAQGDTPRKTALGDTQPDSLTGLEPWMSNGRGAGILHGATGGLNHVRVAWTTSGQHAPAQAGGGGADFLKRWFHETIERESADTVRESYRQARFQIVGAWLPDKAAVGGRDVLALSSPEQSVAWMIDAFGLDPSDGAIESAVGELRVFEMERQRLEAGIIDEIVLAQRSGRFTDLAVVAYAMADRNLFLMDRSDFPLLSADLDSLDEDYLVSEVSSLLEEPR